MKNTILVTGAAGFIGFHLCKRILKEGFDLIGLDNLNSYYDIELKKEPNDTKHFTRITTLNFKTK